MNDKNKLIIIAIIFLISYFLPFENIQLQEAVGESFLMLQDYAQKHVILCLIPAFFIAGAIGVFIKQGSIMKYLGKKANKFISYSVASVSGSILAVCSCTVLPLFSGIYRMGAGIGPATAFLYSGPAINVLAIILTAKVLGLQLGIARAVGAIIFAFVIGFLMSFTFRNEKQDENEINIIQDHNDLNGTKTIAFFATIIGILIFANWADPNTQSGIFHTIFLVKWYITGILSLLFSGMLIVWFEVKWFIPVITSVTVIALSFLFPQYPIIAFSAGIIGLIIALKFAGEKGNDWLESSKAFSIQIMPLLFGGIIIAGFLLGMPGSGKGIIPQEWINSIVGGNSIYANFFASIVGAFMYFATLTEVPILQGLLNAGMGKGPALALLLAGPALSLPNMLVIRSVLGSKRTIVFVTYVVILSTLAGFIFGNIVK